MERYEKYKDSGVEWIGEIPEGWEIKKLKYGVTVNPAKEDIDKDSDELVVFLPMEKVGENGEIDCTVKKPIAALYNGFTFFRKNDVIVAKITPCFENGKGAILNKLATDLGFGSTEFHVLRAKENVNNLFLYYITKSEIFMKVGEAFMSGAAGQKRVPTDFISDFPLVTPHLEYQTAIANYLDRKTAQIDELIAQKERLIELYEEEKAAIINQAVTKGIDPDVRLKDSGIDWLGEIPQGWEAKKLKYVLNIGSGDGIKSEAIKDFGDYPVYGGNGLVGYTNKYNNSDRVFVIGRVGAKCGNVRLVSGEKWISDNALYAYSKGNFDFIKHCLISKDFNRLANKNAQPLITSTMIKEESIFYPPLSEQTAIVHHIKTETTRINTKIDKTKKIIELQKEYRTALISEVVTGKIKIPQETRS